MKFWFIVGLMLALFCHITYAANYTCQGSLNISQVYENISVNATTYTIIYNDTCGIRGCDNNTGQCYPSPYDVNLGSIGILIVLPLLAFIFIFMAKYSSFTVEYHNFAIDPLQILFLGLGLLMIVIDFSLVLNYAVNLNMTQAQSMLTSGYSGIVWGFVIVASILLVFFVYELFKFIIDFGKRKVR